MNSKSKWIKSSVGFVILLGGCQFDLGGDLGIGSVSDKLVFTNAADFRPTVTPGSFATAWGSGLENTQWLRFSYVEREGEANKILEITPALVADRQINFVIPAMHLPQSLGGVVEAVGKSGQVLGRGWIALASAAPALFVDGLGKSLPAGYAIGRKNLPDGKFEDSTINYFVPEEKDFIAIRQATDELFLVLYGEGGQPSRLTAIFAGQVDHQCFSEGETKAVVNDRVEVPILSWGPSSWSGVDQINLRITGLIPAILSSEQRAFVHTLKLMVRDCFGAWKESQTVNLRFGN